MAVGDAPADGQADARSFVFVAAMQPLEDGKDLFSILLVKADAIVLNGDFAKWTNGRRLITICGATRCGANLARHTGLDDTRLDFQDRRAARRLEFETIAD